MAIDAPYLIIESSIQEESLENIGVLVLWILHFENFKENHKAK